MKEIIEQFRKITGYTLEAKDGKLHYGGALDIRGCTGITALPDNLTVGGKLFHTLRII